MRQMRPPRRLQRTVPAFAEKIAVEIKLMILLRF